MIIPFQLNALENIHSRKVTHFDLHAKNLAIYFEFD